MRIKNALGGRIFRDIQEKVANEGKCAKMISYCDLYGDDDNYCTDHQDTDRD